MSRVQSQLAVLPGGDRRPGDASVVFFGMGASFAACAVPVAILAAAGVRATREIASEMHAGLAVPANTLAIGVSQSGRSPETVEVLRRVPADRRCVLTNVAGAALSDVTGLSYDLGSEQDSYASTIGYTGTIVGLAMLAEHLLGATAQDAAAGWHGIGSTLSAVEKETAPLVAAVAQASAGVVAADVVASGPSRAASEAGALLLREVCRVPSAALVTRNYLHGEMEAAGDTLHVIIGDGRERRLARTLADAGHVTLLVTTADAAAATDTAMTDTYPIPAAGGALHLITLPRVSMPVRVVLETLVLQQLAGALADARDIEIEDFVFEHDDTKIGGMVQ
ncbi:SIS domain-containing protein [Sanguibacter gelidistatuariae]|uniref:SIS domain-containing protein n=1 Tax=Sanguibacter gelidistatuariae TaxID=1814289 RepID=UPI001C31E07B|nr:SIS domain-containing protein [Sanguibacter gelidistatuariae]